MERQRAVCARCKRYSPPKYLHSKGFKRNLMLYGEHRYKLDRTDGRVYLVEGHIDVLSMWQAHYRPVNATLGSWPGQPQIEKLIRDHERIIVVGDGDQSGADFVAKVKKMVAQRIPVAMKKLPPKTDPNKLLAEQGVEALRTHLGDPPRAA
jgi:DNA primase